MKLLLGLLALVTVSLAAKVNVKNIRDRSAPGQSSLGSGKVLDLVKEYLSSGKGKTSQDAYGTSYAKINDRLKKYVRSIHLQQQYHGINVFGYSLSVQEVPEQTIEKRNAKTMQLNGDVITVPAMTIVNGEFVDNLDQVVKPEGLKHLARRQDKIFLKVQDDHRQRNGARKKNGFGLDMPSDITPIIHVNDVAGSAVPGYLVRFVDHYNSEPSYPNIIVDEHGAVLEEWEALNTVRSVDHYSLENSYPNIIVDENGAVLKEWEALNTPFGTGPGGNEKIGRVEYDDIPITDLGNGKCQLNTEKIRTIDIEHGFGTSKTTPFEFDCYENTNREINGAYSPMNDAMVFGTDVSNMHNEYYETDPLNRSPIYVRVHVRRNYENAYYDGTGVHFGDGRTFFYPLTALDVVAHEIAHGITAESSGLIYNQQSGGLNEAFSDISGKAVECYVRGANCNAGIGQDITKGELPLRCMDDPPCDGNSIDHVRDYRGQTVHYTSGIFNKAAVAMATTLPNGVKDTYDIIYIANTQYWTQRSTFLSAAELVLQAAQDIKNGMHLPGDYSHLDLEIIKNAFRVVGIDCDAENNCQALP